MAKLQASYKTNPYFYPSKGDLLTDAQVAAMHPEWEPKMDGSVLAIDFADMDGLRSDWLFTETVRYHRMRAVRTFAGALPLWLVIETSY